jgi:hypothetical protein
MGVLRRVARLIPALALATAALIAVGCGSDDGSSEEPLTKEQFIAEADAICTEAVEAVQAEAVERFGPAPSPDLARAKQKKFIEEVSVPALERQRDQLAELVPPEQDQEQIDELLAAMEAAAEMGKEDPGSLLLDQDSPSPEMVTLARDYGLEVCGL